MAATRPVWKYGQKVGDLGTANRSAPLVLDGRVKFTSNGELNFTGGNVSSTAVSAQLNECQKSNQITIEAMIKTESLDQSGPARIITFSQNTNSRNFTLGQEKNNRFRETDSHSGKPHPRRLPGNSRGLLGRNRLHPSQPPVSGKEAAQSP